MAGDTHGGPILRSVLMLFSGTVLAQAIPLLAAPVFSRLFDAPQFALFGAVMAVFNVLNVLATGRYEMAVVVPQDRRAASDLVRGAVLVSIGMGLLALVLLRTMHGPLERQAGLPALDAVLGLLAVLTTLGGVQVTFQQWLLRHKAFTALAQVKVLQAVAITLATLVLGWLGLYEGLVLGYVVGWVLFAVATVVVAWRLHPLEGRFDASRVRDVLLHYRDWPLHNAWPAVLNAVGSGLAVIYMTMYFDPETAGQHNFARQYLLTPISMVTVALGQVLFVRTAEKVRDGEAVAPELRRVFRFLVIAAVVIGTVLLVAGPYLFELVFGSAWTLAGEASRVLMAGYMAQLLFSPFGVVLLALRKVKATKVFPVVFVALMALPLLFRSLPSMPFMGLLSAIEVVSYFTLGLIVRHAVLHHDRSLVPNMTGVGR